MNDFRLKLYMSAALVGKWAFHFMLIFLFFCNTVRPPLSTPPSLIRLNGCPAKNWPEQICLKSQMVNLPICLSAQNCLGTHGGIIEVWLFMYYFYSCSYIHVFIHVCGVHIWRAKCRRNTVTFRSIHFCCNCKNLVVMRMRTS